MARWRQRPQPTTLRWPGATGNLVVAVQARVDPAYEQKYYRIERAHAWSVGRRDLVASMLEVFGVPRAARVLDVGCGGGLLVEKLAAAGYTAVSGIDASQVAVDAASRQGIRGVTCADATSTDFDDAAFDVVVASDVLEHILDEGRALHEWKRIVRPGGLVLIYVPAFSFLWSVHDEVNRHFRRYSRSQLQSVVLGAGYELDRIGYWNTALFPPTLLVRMVTRMRRDRAPSAENDAFLELNPVTNRVLTSVLLAENRLIAAGFDPPIGVSVYAVCRRPLD
jgi:2-polyprenyl-3-methyl-5-hydroxy-6-metoxy-1,4-benzoquinol methylase